MLTDTFRGKSTIDKTWKYGHLNIQRDDSDIEHAYIITNNASYEVDIDTIGQITGAHDRNGLDIFTDDIISCPFKTDDNTAMEDKFIVMFSETYAYSVRHIDTGIEHPLYCYAGESCYIAGNIHDKPYEKPVKGSI